MPYLPRPLAAAILTGVLATAPATSAARQAVPRLKLPADYAAWSRVASCESGGWRVLGSGPYPDPIGMTRANYIAFGGRPLPVGPVPIATRIAVIKVADRFIAHYGIAIPDQHGCASW